MPINVNQSFSITYYLHTLKQNSKVAGLDAIKLGRPVMGEMRGGGDVKK